MLPDPTGALLDAKVRAALGRTALSMHELHRLLEDAMPPRRRWLVFSERQRLPPIIRVERFADEGFFEPALVFTIFVDDPILEGHVLPGGGSFGLFVLCVAGCYYMQRQPAALTALLSSSGRPLSNCDPLVLARLYAEALLRRGNVSHSILMGEDALLRYGQGGPGGYQVDLTQLRRVSDRGVQLLAPTLTKARREGAHRAAGVHAAVGPYRENDGGWVLRFFSLSGWMHEQSTLMQHEVLIGEDYAIRAEPARVLSRCIFREMPAVKY
jgi:hypothetical protein